MIKDILDEVVPLPLHDTGLIAIHIKSQRNATCSSNLFPSVSGGKQGIQEIEEE